MGMNSTYRIDSERSLVFKNHVGPITVDDEITLLNQIISDPDFRTGMSAICDFSKAEVDWELHDLDKFRAFVRRVRDSVGECKWAIISPGGATDLTAKLFITLHEAFEANIKVKLFTNEDDAIAWVGKVSRDQPVE